jgi:hypothetical protein
MSELVAPTYYADVNEVLHSFEARLLTLLGSHFVGMYPSGSLALGDFDPQSSDIDMVIVTDVELSGDLFAALHDLHAHFDESRSPWAAKVEAVYIPPEALRHSAPTPAQYPQIEKGRTLFLDHLESGWIFHCYTLREHGVIVAGPGPHTLIDPVDPDAMRRAAATIAGIWLEQAQHDPDWLTWLHPRKHQAFVVLTLCRLLYTLDSGTLASKPAAARWAQKTLGRRWAGPIERSRAGLHTSEETLESDANETVTFIHYTVERFRQRDTSPPDEGKSGG